MPKKQKGQRIAPLPLAYTLPRYFATLETAENYCSGLSVAVATALTLKRMTPDWSLKK